MTDNTGLSSNMANQSVTVNNVAPTVNFIAPLVASANEGDTKTFTVTVSDPGLDTFIVLAGFPDCGTGGILIGSFVPTSSGGTFQCRFPDGPSTATDPTVRMRVKDSTTPTATPRRSQSMSPTSIRRCPTRLHLQPVHRNRLRPDRLLGSWLARYAHGCLQLGGLWTEPGHPLRSTVRGRDGTVHLDRTFGPGCITGAVTSQ